MRAAIARRYGSAEVAAVEDVPLPTPKRFEVLVEVSASSFNALDHHCLTGTPYLMRMMLGFSKPKRQIQGAEVSGTVRAIGVGVKRFCCWR